MCIQQTVIELLEHGFEVHVVADATSSRSQMDRLLALQACTVFLYSTYKTSCFDTALHSIFRPEYYSIMFEHSRQICVKD